jgi:hypothetical protein
VHKQIRSAFKRVRLFVIACHLLARQTGRSYDISILNVHAEYKRNYENNGFMGN